MDTIQILLLVGWVIASVVIILFWYYVFVLTADDRPYKRGADMNFIEKYVKKQRLIDKYTPNTRTAFLVNLMKDCEPFMKHYRHRIGCELRLLDRIKKL